MALIQIFYAQLSLQFSLDWGLFYARIGDKVVVAWRNPERRMLYNIIIESWFSELCYACLYMPRYGLQYMALFELYNPSCVLLSLDWNNNVAKCKTCVPPIIPDMAKFAIHPSSSSSSSPITAHSHHTKADTRRKKSVQNMHTNTITTTTPISPPQTNKNTATTSSNSQHRV